MKKETPITAFAIDFDNTISDTHFNTETGGYDMGDVLPDMKETINHLAKDHQIIIHTARPKEQWHSVTRYLAEHGVVFDRIAEKPLAIAYVDDKAMLPHEFVDKFKPREKKPIDIDEWYRGEQD